MNVGAGKATSILDVAKAVVSYFNSSSLIEVTGDFRLGDIRHNWADLGFAQSRVEYVPRYSFYEGINSFLNWVSEQSLQKCSFTTSMSELESVGMLIRVSRDGLHK